jgi:flagellar basal-body rod protein FlgC
MSLFDIFGIAGSGLAAQSQRLNVVASNLANADSTTSANGQPYRARQVVFETVPISNPGLNAGRDASGAGAGAAAGAGVRVSGVVEDTSPLRRHYDPRHPMADEQGYVSSPNVNVVEEMVNMISASRSYQTNADMMNTAKSLLLKTLTLGN